MFGFALHPRGCEEFGLAAHERTADRPPHSRLDRRVNGLDHGRGRRCGIGFGLLDLGIPGSAICGVTGNRPASTARRNRRSTCWSPHTAAYSNVRSTLVIKPDKPFKNLIVFNY